MINEKLIITVLIFFTLTALTSVRAQLIQHLDANISGSVILDANNVVTEWVDQSGAGNNAVQQFDSVFYTVGTGDEPSWIDFMDTACAMQIFTPEGSDIWLDQSAGTGGF